MENQTADDQKKGDEVPNGTAVAEKQEPATAPPEEKTEGPAPDVSTGEAEATPSKSAPATSEKGGPAPEISTGDPGAKSDAPAPVTADDINRGPDAPPDYEKVMGQNETSIIFAQPELPPLSYIDIMPRVLDPGNIRYKKSPVFERFSDIINGANMWLLHHPDLLCWKCETVERRVEIGTKINLSAMSYHESGEGFNVHVLGLRIWFVRKYDGSPVQQLGLHNVVPESTMSECVSQLNVDLGRSPLPGTILNVETATLRYTVGMTKFDPENTCFSEMGASGVSMRKTKQIIRVFYVRGPSRGETVYMQEIHPRQIRFSGSKSATKFEPFDGVVQQAQQWLQAQSGIRVVNIETRDVQAKDQNMKITIFSDKMDDFLSDSDCMYVKILRIFFVNTPEVTTYATTVLTSRIFTPMKIGGKSFETMGQTMARILNWLSITQLQIFSVETVYFPFVPTAIGCKPERVDYGLVEGAGRKWITGIRLYFPTPFIEPAPVHTHKSSSSCTIL